MSSVEEIIAILKEDIDHAERQGFLPANLAMLKLQVATYERLAVLIEAQQDVVENSTFKDAPDYCGQCKSWHSDAVPHVILPHKESEEHHTGMMLAFFLDPKVARQLAIPDGEAPDGLHITLCFLGDVSEFTADVGHLKATVARFASDCVPLGGQTGGIGCFDPSEHSDNLVPVVALVNVQGLQEFRRKLAEMLDNAGVYIAKNYDYLPHITLLYADPDKPLPLRHLPVPAPLTFDTLWLCIGDERTPYKLGDTQHANNHSVSGATDTGSTTNDVLSSQESTVQLGGTPGSPDQVSVRTGGSACTVERILDLSQERTTDEIEEPYAEQTTHPQGNEAGTEQENTHEETSNGETNSLSPDITEDETNRERATKANPTDSTEGQ